MATRVPDIHNFSLQDVDNVSGLGYGSLSSNIYMANVNYFDSRYNNGIYDRLSIFRNYGPSPTISVSGYDGGIIAISGSNSSYASILSLSLYDDYRHTITVTSNIPWVIHSLTGSIFTASPSSGGEGSTSVLLSCGTTGYTSYAISGNFVITPVNVSSPKVFLSTKRDGLSSGSTPVYTFIPDKDVYGLSFHNHTFPIGVTSNVSSYTVSRSHTWFSVSPTSAGGNTTLTVNVGEYLTSDIGVWRTGTITLSGSGVTKVITIKQYSRYQYNFDSSEGGSSTGIIDTLNDLMMDPGDEQMTPNE